MAFAFFFTFRNQTAFPGARFIAADDSRVQHELQSFEGRLREFECKLRSLAAARPATAASDPRARQDLQELQRRVQLLEDAARTKVADKTDSPTPEARILEKLNKIEARLVQLEKDKVPQVAGPSHTAGKEDGPASGKVEVMPSSMTREEQAARVGEIFASFCRDRREHFLDDYSRFIRSSFPFAEVQQAYLTGGAYQVYFTDKPESNPHCYWRVALDGNNFLLPRPASADRFECLEGFEVEETRPPVPQSVCTCRPAILTRAQHRWEVEQLGKLT